MIKVCGEAYFIAITNIPIYQSPHRTPLIIELVGGARGHAASLIGRVAPLRKIASKRWRASLACRIETVPGDAAQAPDIDREAASTNRLKWLKSPTVVLFALAHGGDANAL